MSTEFVNAPADTEHPKDTDQEYQQKMIEKAEAGLGGQSGGGEGEEKLFAGKYKSEDDLQKGALELLKQKHGGNLEAAYKELERGFHSSGSDEPSSNQEDTSTENKGEEKSTEEKDDKTQKQVADLQFDRYTEEFITQGNLSEDSVKEITEAGIPQELLDQYVEGLRAVAKINQDHAFSVTDGEENYRKMLDWAQKNLPKEEIDQYNRSLLEPDLNKRGKHIEALYEKFTESNPQLLEGNQRGPVPPGDVYQSIEQLKADQRDPRYTKDPAFRDKVMKKLARSKVL
jgi:hypothetical protein